MYPSNPFPVLPTYLFEPNLAGTISLILTLVLPVFAALFMKASWSPTVKAVVLLAASAVKTLLEQWLVSLNNGYVVDWWTLTYTVLLNLVIAIAGYFGLGIKGSSPQQAALNGGVFHDRAVN